MSKAETNNASDDEFEDALSDVPNNAQQAEKAKEKDLSVDELIEQQINMSLKDEDYEFFKDAKADDVKAEVTDDEQNKDDDGYIEEIIDEDELRESEKAMTTEDLQKNKEKADKLKLDGNELFKNDKAVEAIEKYTQALKICPTTNSKERAILYGNRAAAKIKLDLKKSALDDCSSAIKLWPEYVRALLRRAKLNECQDKLDQALEDYKRVYELDPGQHEAREACVRLPPIINERNEKMKAEAIDKLKELGNMILKPFGLSTSNFQVQQDPNSGGYSINFNQKSS